MRGFAGCSTGEVAARAPELLMGNGACQTWKAQQMFRRPLRAVVHFSLADVQAGVRCQAGDACRVPVPCTTHLPKLGSTITVERRVGGVVQAGVIQ